MRNSARSTLRRRPLQAASRFCYQVNNSEDCRNIVFGEDRFFCPKGHMTTDFPNSSLAALRGGETSRAIDSVIVSAPKQERELDRLSVDEQFVFHPHMIANDSPAAKAKRWTLSEPELIELSVLEDIDTIYNLTKNPNAPKEALANIAQKENLPLEVWLNVVGHRNLSGELAIQIFRLASNRPKIIERILERANCPEELLLEALQTYDSLYLQSSPC